EVGRRLVRVRSGRRRARPFTRSRTPHRLIPEVLWWGGVGAAALYSLRLVTSFVAPVASPAEVLHVLALAGATLLRVVVLIGLASLVWVPIGVAIGLRPALAERSQGIAQFVAAFPANLLFPAFVAAIARWRLDPNVWLSPLMILGTQWYILFNV